MTISYFSGPLLPDSSEDSIREGNRDQLRQAIREFFHAASLNPQRSICPRCGRAMQHIDATFSLYGSDTEWTAQLPVCSCAAKLSVKDLSV